MLVLLTEGVYEIAIEMASCVMIYVLSFMKIGTGVQAIFRRCLKNLTGCSVSVTGGRDL
jgi:hypothetical protein